VRTEAWDGKQSATWDGNDDRGRPMASGIYVVRVSWPGGTAAGRLTLLR
jgi:hypothetical protein